MGIFSKQKSLWGLKSYISPDDLLVSRGAVGTGGEGRPRVVMPGSHDTVAVFEDFLGDLVPDEWIAGSSDTGQTATGVLATSAVSATNGIYRMTSSATSTQTPAGGAQSINTPPNWKANQGRLRMSARVKTAVLAGNSVFVGFTDTGGTEIAAYDTGGGIQTPAGDYAGFIWSGEAGATEQAYRAVAGKAGTDQSATTGVTPVANVYDVLEVELPGTDGGVANFYINGKPVARFSSAAVTPTVALAAGVWRANTEGAADAVDVDYINISAARDTGL